MDRTDARGPRRPQAMGGRRCRPGSMSPGPSSRSEIAVLTVSDTRTLETDSSGSILAERIFAAGHRLHARRIVPDRGRGDPGRGARMDGRRRLRCSHHDRWDGTDRARRNPEAVEPLLDKVIDGFSTIFHQVSLRSRWACRRFSRARSPGSRRGTFVFCLPGSERRGEGRLGRGDPPSARQSLSAMQPGRDHVSARREGIMSESHACRTGRPAADGRRFGQAGNRSPRRRDAASSEVDADTLDRVRSGTTAKGSVARSPRSPESWRRSGRTS